MNNKIWLSSPHMGGNEEAYVKEAFETNWIAPLGPNVNNFESDLATYCGVKSVAALSSGTGALHLALILLGIEAGDEVLCQSFTFSASANPIRYQQATPVFVDSEPHTWNMDPVALEEAIIDRRSKGKQPKAIIVVHLYGMPAKMDDILDVAHKYDIPIIEDAAEALGSSYNGQKCGSFGNFGILSFNGNKIITTSGGGALLSNDEAMIQKARFLATQARDDAPHYQHSHIGYNYRMSNVIAGIGRGQMEVIEDRVKARRRVNDFYVKLFKDVEGIEVLREPNERFFSNMWLTTITIDSQITGFTREDLRLRLLEDNIESRPLWKPMHLQPVFNEYLYYGGNIAEKLFINGLCLPSGSNMTEHDLERIKHSIMQEINKHV
jgi:dTDP-4-amino-4,6-dideoxygalactose transaminase